jgi:hypothetical protein
MNGRKRSRNGQERRQELNRVGTQLTTSERIVENSHGTVTLTHQKRKKHSR